MNLKVVFILLIMFNQAFGQITNMDQKITVKTSLSHDTIAIGDQIVFKIKTVIPADYTIQFPTLVDSLTKNIEVIRKAKIDSINLGNNLKEISFSTFITSFDSGVHTMPSLPLIINKDTLYTDSLLLSVFVLPKDTAVKDIYDIKTPLPVPLTFAEIAPWAGGGLILAALIFLLVLYLRSRKQNKPFILLQKPSEPPHITAIRKLDKIRDDKLWSSEDHKLYYTMLTDVLRVYIEGRFMVAAMEQTTDEIIKELRSVEGSHTEILEQLQELLMVSDLVKFAKFTPIINENERYLNFAYTFVDKTKQDTIDNELMSNVEPVDIRNSGDVELSAEVTNLKVN